VVTDQQMLVKTFWPAHNLLVNSCCVTYDSILFGNSMAQMADLADDNDIAAAEICSIT